MTSTPEGLALPADPVRANAYDRIAEAYTAENETSLMNAYYERPAMLELAGNVTGRRILDAGCGSGPLFAALRDRGATVTGVDASAGMVEMARRRLLWSLNRSISLTPRCRSSTAKASITTSCSLVCQAARCQPGVTI